jgi:hypothetical protein
VRERRFGSGRFVRWLAPVHRSTANVGLSLESLPFAGESLLKTETCNQMSNKTQNVYWSVNTNCTELLYVGRFNVQYSGTRL